MKNKIFLFIVTLTISAHAFSQQDNLVTIERDYSLARVGQKMFGVYIFFLCDPYFEYDYIATVDVKINWSGLLNESFEKIIKKAQKKFTNFNGIIFRTNDLTKAELIRFKELEVARGGFAIGDKVSFIEDEVYCVGEIIQLGIGKEEISIQYISKSGVKTVKEIKPINLTPISDETFNAKKNSDVASSDSVFKVGDVVQWEHGSITMTGEVIEVNDNTCVVKRKNGLTHTVEFNKLKKT